MRFLSDDTGPVITKTHGLNKLKEKDRKTTSLPNNAVDCEDLHNVSEVQLMMKNSPPSSLTVAASYDSFTHLFYKDNEH